MRRMKFFIKQTVYPLFGEDWLARAGYFSQFAENSGSDSFGSTA